VAKLNLSSLLEAFALGAGIPLSVLRTVPVHKVSVSQAEARAKDVILKPHNEDLLSEEGNHDE